MQDKFTKLHAYKVLEMWSKIYNVLELAPKSTDFVVKSWDIRPKSCICMVQYVGYSSLSTVGHHML